MNKNTMNAIQKRINNGETRFYMGTYYYECNENGIIRRREQQPDRTPTSGWEQVSKWNPYTREIDHQEKK